MQKYTITRIGTEKEVNTKFGLKHKTGVLFKETGDVWHDLWKKKSELTVGQVVEGTRDSREYEGKIYWDFKFPKKDEVLTAKTGDLEKRVTLLENKVFGDKAPDYPEDDINPEDIPF